MNLKLKDEIIKMLIENQKMSINEISKKTGNYYSYVHKLISLMEKEGKIFVKKFKIKNKIVTEVFLNENYKNEWINDLKKMLKSALKNAEIKISLILMYALLANNYLNKETNVKSASLADLSQGIASDSLREINPEIVIDYYLIALILIPLLIAFWVIRKMKK
ncbi:MAG: winged helix-turn-helix transcriptional regulator [Candidatus Nanoarchaeia archaeon]|nr:winged helix-turn-helix transcriptional regulator [Candidatus Nanoarchaeia archaeon]